MPEGAGHVLEGILLELGTEMALRVFEAKAGSLARAGTIAERLVGGGLGLIESRRAQRQFEQIAESLAERLQQQMASELGQLPENELRAAVEAVRDGFRAADITGESLVQADLDPVQLEAAVERTSRYIVQSAALAPGAEALRARLVRECSNYVVELAASLPEFDSVMLRELLRRGSMLIERVDRILQNLPLGGLAVPASADEDFELRYSRALALRLDYLQLFGLTLSEDARRYRLTVAYINLTMRADSGPDVDELSAEDLPVESIVRSTNRLAIRGEAGSGKTTLLQWVAVNAARSAFDASSEDLNTFVPFFIQLRHYLNRDLPAPVEFLAKVTPLVAASQPDGWVDRVLREGRGMILVDGVDELPGDQRESVREWLRALVEEYPECRLVVTSRPAAMGMDWLDSLGFQSFELVPMDLPSVRSFIEHWHEAAAEDLRDTAELAELNNYARRLAEIVVTDPPIRALAGTPLLCAMLCALNRDRRTRLPSDRMELYRIALETLLDRRDIERNVEPTGIQLTLTQKLALLQDVAFWMLLNSASYITRESIVEKIRSKTALMPHIDAPPEAILRYLLLRSGVIREPILGSVDFIHRTFQEYLGAREAVLQNNIGLLIERAREDQWREVVVLASGHASQAQREQLVGGLLDRGDCEPSERHVMHLLAVACLETALEIQPRLVARIEESLAGLVPPASMSEARALASAGTLAVSALANAEHLRAVEAAASVRALALIGGREAMNAIANLAADSRKTVVKEVIRAWQEFDSREYAQTVISRVPPMPAGLELSDLDHAVAAQDINSVEWLNITLPRSTADLSSLGGNAKVFALSLLGNRRLTDISPVATLASLRWLDLEGCVSIEDFSPLRPTMLSWLDLSGTRIQSLADLPVAGSLEELRLDYTSALQSLRGIDNSLQMRQLRIAGKNRVCDWTPLAHLEQLETFVASDTGFPDLRYVSRNLSLSHLRVNGPVAGLESLSQLGALEVLSVDVGSDSRAGLGAISQLTALRRLSVSSADSANLDFVPEAVEDLLIQDSSVVTIDGIPKSAWQISFIGCQRLVDISAIRSLEDLSRVRIFGSPGVDLDVLLEIPPWVTVDVDVATLAGREVIPRRNVRVYSSGRRAMRVG